MAEKQTQPSVDKDLDQLLDSVLDDFDSTKQIVEPSKEPAAAAAGKNVTSAGAKGTTSSPDESGPWTAEFAQMEEAMKKFLTDQDPLLQEQLSKIAQCASKAAGASDDAEFSATLQETLETITKSVDQFQPPEGAELGGGGMDEMTRLLGAMGLGGANAPGGEVGGFIQMMQGVMQHLLSKDLLYPALKDLTEKYPKWLADNKDSTSEADIARYEKQLAIMVKVCDAFDEEQESDADDLKKERFARILKLMQEMQECGSPPAELVPAGESIPGFPTDQFPDMPAPPSECNQQ